MCSLPSLDLWTLTKVGLGLMGSYKTGPTPLLCMYNSLRICHLPLKSKHTLDCEISVRLNLLVASTRCSSKHLPAFNLREMSGFHRCRLIK